MIRKVFDISDINLADVPRRLRDLAAELEEPGQSVRACVVVLDYMNGDIDVRGLGKDADDLRAIGLLEAGKALMAVSLIDPDNRGRNPTPVA